MLIKTSCSLFMALALWSLMPQRAGAETVYAVDGSKVLSVNTVTRVTTQLFDLSTWSPSGTAWSGGGNELAYDASTNNLIFAERSGNRVATFNLGSSTASVIGNLDLFSSVTSTVSGGTVVGKMDGGAFYFNDSYYFTVEGADGGASSHSRFYRAYLNAAHNGFTSIGLGTFGGGNPFLGDFGDMAVNPSGIVYGASSGTGSGVLNGFWKFDINNLAGGITSISTSTALAQLAFSSDFTTLYASHFSSSDFGTINLTTGVYTNSGSLSGASTGLTDMTAAVSPVPEPSSALLLVVGVMLLFRRRSGSVSPIRLAR